MYILAGKGLGLTQPALTEVASANLAGSTTTASVIVPKLIKTETFPALYTMYVDINLNPVVETYRNKKTNQWEKRKVHVTPMTGIFIPKTYVPQSTVNLILYLHGFKAPCGLSEKATINEYWSQGFFKRLREDINDSGKNVIFVSPTLGPKSGAGKLIKAGGFNAFLDQVLAALNAYNPLNKIAFINRFTRAESIGNIILACHSGGGKPMRAIATLNPSTDSYVTHIKECWGFDCLYGSDDAKFWKEWARSHSNTNLFVYYQKSTSDQSERLRHKPPHPSNVCVQNSDAKNHCSVPSKHWKKRLQNIP